MDQRRRFLSNEEEEEKEGELKETSSHPATTNNNCNHYCSNISLIEVLALMFLWCMSRLVPLLERAMPLLYFVHDSDFDDTRTM